MEGKRGKRRKEGEGGEGMKKEERQDGEGQNGRMEEGVGEREGKERMKLRTSKTESKSGLDQGQR